VSVSGLESFGDGGLLVVLVLPGTEAKGGNGSTGVKLVGRHVALLL
jgi:hypothetical protein